MSTQIVFRKKGIFNKKVNYNEMLSKLNLNIYKEEEYTEGKFIVYNKTKIGFGILIDNTRKKEISFLISKFVTITELDDLYKIIEYLTKRINNYELYIAGEYITLGSFETIKQTILEMSKGQLQLQCKKTIDSLEKLNLLFEDYIVSEDFKNKFGYCDNMNEYENFLHDIQKNKIVL